MVKTASTMKKIGTPAPDFNLMNIDGRMVGLHDFDEQRGLLVIFLCNHCPFVKHVADGLARLASDYIPKGIAVVGINSNDVDAYPPTTLQSAWQRRSSGWVTRFRTCSTRASR